MICGPFPIGRRSDGEIGEIWYPGLRTSRKVVLGSSSADEFLGEARGEASGVAKPDPLFRTLENMDDIGRFLGEDRIDKRPVDIGG